jgi:hypothetical protein
MNLWAQMNDFPDYNKRIPCVLCKGDSEKTIVGDHWKCSVCAHLFNQDESKLLVECWCETCKPPIGTLYDETEKRVSAKKIGKKRKKK